MAPVRPPASLRLVLAESQAEQAVRRAASHLGAAVVVAGDRSIEVAGQSVGSFDDDYIHAVRFDAVDERGQAWSFAPLIPASRDSSTSS